MSDTKNLQSTNNLSPEDTEASKRVIERGLLAYGLSSDPQKTKEAILEGLRQEFPHMKYKTEDELINPLRYLGAHCFQILGIEEPKNAKSYKKTIDGYAKHIVNNHLKSL